MYHLYQVAVIRLTALASSKGSSTYVKVRLRRFLLAAFLVLRLQLGITVALIVLLSAHPTFAAQAVKEGLPVPTFVLTDENDKQVDMATLLDRPAIIYFTHNSCHYCTQIIALLKRADAKFGNKNLRIIGVNIMAKDSKLVKAYKKELGFTFPMFAGNRDDVLTAYKINYVPLLVFVDSNKNVKRVVGHYVHEKVLHGYINEILEKGGK
jgi:peroxiredoxin